MDPKRLQLPPLPRPAEEAQIRQALEDASTLSSFQVVFIAGQTGTGKTNLALAASTGGKSCWHARSKFDGRPSNAPLTQLRHLVGELLQSTLSDACSLTSKALYTQLTERQYHVLTRFAALSFTLNGDGVAAAAAAAAASADLDAAAAAAALVEQERQEETKRADDEMHLNHKDHNDAPSTTSREALFQDESSSLSMSSLSTSFHGDGNLAKDSLGVLISSLKACLRAIASVSTIVLTIDDIHWACPTTLDVLQQIVSDSTLGNILLVATFRTSEETATPKFYDWKTQIEENTHNHQTTNCQTILLDNLSQHQVQEWLADATSRSMDDVHDLAETVYGFTNGNVFFMKHFLEQLQDDQLLYFDLQQYQWKWEDAAAIKRRSSLSENVVQTLASRITKLPKPVQNVLMLAACFGATFDVRALDAAKSALDVHCVYQTLRQAHEQEFVIQLNEPHYKFAHDMIQLTAYGLLPDDMDLQHLHWKIGCSLLQRKELLQDDTILFATVDHLNMADPDQLDAYCHTNTMRRTLAELNFKAGCKAATLSAFVPASRYLATGIASLGEAPFETCYKLASKLYQLSATTEYVTGNIHASIEAAEQVLEHAKTCEEKVPAMAVVVDCYIAQNDNQQLVQFCLTKLEQLGEKIPRKPNTVQVQMEFQKMKLRLKHWSDEDILAMPPMTDFRQELILQLIHRLIWPLYHLEETFLTSLVTCRMVHVTLNHGFSKAATPYALVMAASNIVGSSSHDIREGYRLGKLAETLVKRNGGIDSNTSQTMGMISNMTKWWLEPVPNCLDLFIDSHKIAMKSGHVGYAFQLTVGYGANYFYAGLPLEPLLQDVEKYCGQYLEYNQVMFFLLQSPLWQCLLNLTGRSDNPASMQEGIVIERRKAIPNNKGGEQSIQSFQMILSYYLGDLPKASEMAEILTTTAKPGLMKSSFWYSSRRFFLALIAIANYRLTHKRSDKVEAEKHVKFFRKVVKAGAINLVHKLQLLEAEMMSIGVGHSSSTATTTTKDVDAIFRHYDDAIVSATRTGFLQDAALANYLCFQYCQSHNVRLHLSDLYLKRSLELWISWGALAVASSLVDRHSDLFGSDTAAVRNSLTCSLQDDSSSLRNSGSGSSLRGRPRFDASLSAQHKQLNVQ